MAVVCFAIAAAFVGSEAFRLGHETPAAIFDLDEAVDAVGDALPGERRPGSPTTRCATLILATLDHLRAKGLTRPAGRGPAPAVSEPRWSWRR